MKRYSVSIEGRQVEVWCERLGQQLWYHYEGETYQYSPPVKTRGGGRGAISHSDVVSPMPGKIIKILVKVGDKVISGQPVVMMEAMKMEYTLEARQEGLIDQINCKIGDQVALGITLISVGKDGEGQ